MWVAEGAVPPAKMILLPGKMAQPGPERLAGESGPGLQVPRLNMSEVAVEMVCEGK